MSYGIIEEKIENESIDMSHHLSAPQWELHSEYPGFDSPAYQADLQRIASCIEQLSTAAPALAGPNALSEAQQMAVLQKEADLLLYNLSSYAYLSRSTDSKNAPARTALDRLRKLGVKLTQSLQPLQQFVLRSTDEVFAEFLAHPELSDSQFYYTHQREKASTLLPLEHENLLSGLRLDGHHAWGHLYSNLTGSIEHEIEIDGEKEVVGVAYLLSLLSSKESHLRQLAYENLNTVFTTHQETCAAILNALAGWRLEMCKRRSAIQPVDFLSEPLHSNRMQRGTLNTMIEMSREHRGLGQKMLKLQARLLNKTQVDPWDGQAPAPDLGEKKPPLPFEDAMDIIVKAFNEVDPSMGEFARMMQTNQWIDAADLPHKTPGAFCAGFPKSRTPRVLMTYMGTASNLTTLAHELGHAFHSWVMRDMPLRETRYVPGDLFSVNEATANGVPNLFARNERLVCIFDTEHGPAAVILVGAMIVAGIETVFSGQVTPLPKQVVTTDYQRTAPITLEKGDELGRFLLGSTVVLLFPEGKARFESDLKAGSLVRVKGKLGQYNQDNPA